MPRTSTSSETLTKISNAMESLKREFSTTEFKKWDVKDYPRRFSISTTFPTVLRNLGAIESNPNQRGEIKVTTKLFTLTPTVVVRNINSYGKQSRKRVKALKQKYAQKPVKAAAVRTIPVRKEVTFDALMTALKEKMKKEVMTELLSSLTK